MSENIQGLFDGAIAKDKAGEGGEALRLLDALLDYQSDHRLALFYRGGIKIRYRKDFEGAMRDWEAAFSGAPAGAWERVRELYPLLVESCMERLIQNTSLDPHNAGFHSAFGRASFLSGDPDRAERHLRRALELDSSRFLDALKLAEVLKLRGKSEESFQMLQKQTEATPGESSVQATMGLLCRELGRTALAIKHLELAIAANSRNFPARQALAEIFLTQGRTGQAESHFKILAEQEPTAEAHLGLAECAKQEFRMDEALDHHRKAVKLDPGSYRALAGLGSLALQMGNAALGIHSLQAALEIDPAHPEVYAQLAQYAVQRGDAAEAVKALRLQLHYDPKDTYAAETLLQQLRSQGKLQECSDLLQIMLQQRPGDLQLTLQLADLYMQLERRTEALALLQQAYLQHPAHEQLKSAMAKILA